MLIQNFSLRKLQYLPEEYINNINSKVIVYPGMKYLLWFLYFIASYA